MAESGPKIEHQSTDGYRGKRDQMYAKVIKENVRLVIL